MTDIEIDDATVRTAAKAYWEFYKTGEGPEDPAVNGRLCMRAALEAVSSVFVEQVRKEIADEISLAQEWQLDDPRISYVEVQMSKDTYRELRGLT